MFSNSFNGKNLTPWGVPLFPSLFLLDNAFTNHLTKLPRIHLRQPSPIDPLPSMSHLSLTDLMVMVLIAGASQLVHDVLVHVSYK